MQIVPWVGCPDCDKFVCNIHEQHVADCDCPSIDVWAEHSLWPYGHIDLVEVDVFLAANKFEDEEEDDGNI